MFELKIVNHFAAAHQLTMVAKKVRKPSRAQLESGGIC
jgi:hypothetical protein